MWEKRRDRNESLDCRVYARAAAASLRIETWAPEKWDEMQKALTIERPSMQSAAKDRSALAPTPEFKPMRGGDSFLE